MRSDRERLLDIVEAIERVDRYTARGRDAFENDELVQTRVVQHLQIIGEASRAVSDDFKRDHPDVLWPKIVGMRNILAHHCFGIDPEAVCRVVETDPPELKRKVKHMLNKPPGSSTPQES